MFSRVTSSALCPANWNRLCSAVNLPDHEELPKLRPRLAKHQLAAGGVTGTVGVSGQTLRLQCIRRNPDWTTVTQTLTANYQTQANGTTAFSVTGLAGQSGVCRLTAWLDWGDRGRRHLRGESGRLGHP